VYQGTIRGISAGIPQKSATATAEYLFNTGRKLKATNAMHGITSYMFTVSETQKARTMTSSFSFPRFLCTKYGQ
jgi:hypothetical protein